MPGGRGADRHGLLTFEPVADSAGAGVRVNNGDVPVTSGYNCSEVRPGEGAVINSPGARLGGLLPRLKSVYI